MQSRLFTFKNWVFLLFKMTWIARLCSRGYLHHLYVSLKDTFSHSPVALWASNDTASAMWPADPGSPASSSSSRRSRATNTCSWNQSWKARLASRYYATLETSKTRSTLETWPCPTSPSLWSCRKPIHWHGREVDSQFTIPSRWKTSQIIFWHPESGKRHRMVITMSRTLKTRWKSEDPILVKTT